MYASENQTLLKPFDLLLSPDCKNSIIICEVKTTPHDNHTHKKNQSTDDLIQFAATGIDFYQKKIIADDLRLLIFGNKKKSHQNLKDCTVGIYKKQKNGRLETTRSYDRKNTLSGKNKNHSRIIYNIPWYSSHNSHEKQEHMNNIYDKLSENNIPALILIDNVLSYKNDDIARELYSIFNGKKRIVICNPYAETTIENYQPPINILDYAFPCTYLFTLGSLLLAYYHYNAEVGT